MNWTASARRGAAARLGPGQEGGEASTWCALEVRGETANPAVVKRRRGDDPGWVLHGSVELAMVAMATALGASRLEVMVERTLVGQEEVAEGGARKLSELGHEAAMATAPGA